MPSLRAHMVFISHLRDILPGELPELGRAVDAHWAAALMGSEGPDGWYFVKGAKRPDTHVLDTEDPSTWPGAMDRWLEMHAGVRPGRGQPPEVAAFLAGYLSHLGLDTWGEQLQHEHYPADARAAAPASYYPPGLGGFDRVRAALRRLGDAPFPAERMVTDAQLNAVSAPAQFNPNEVRRVASGMLPSLPLSDPWEISQVNPLRQVPADAAARAAWERSRAALADATDAEYQALLAGATAFTVDLLKKWW